MTAGVAVEVRAFVPGDEPAVLEVLRAAFGEWPRGIEGVTPSEFFRWKHIEGPYGPSSVLVAEADGEIIGLLAYMRWRFRAGEQMLETMRGVDFAVHPDRRRPGASSALTRAAVEHFPSDLAFAWGNPNGKGAPVSLKSGWHDVGKVTRFLQPRPSLLGTIAGRSVIKGPPAPAGGRITTASAAELLGDRTFVSRLLAGHEVRDGRMTTARDVDYLRWRYGRFSEYRAVRTEPGGCGNGLAIFRPRRHGRFSVLDICELLVDTNERGISRQLVRKALDGAPANFVSRTHPSRREAAGRGFIQLPHTEVLVSYPLQQNGVPDSTRRASWALSRGDLELL